MHTTETKARFEPDLSREALFLIQAAQQFIDDHYGYLYKSTRFLLKDAIQNALNGDDSELMHQYSRAISEAKRNRDQCEAVHRKKLEYAEMLINYEITHFSPAQIRRKLAKARAKSLQYKERHDNLRLGERTRRRWRMNTSIEMNAREIMILEAAVERIERIETAPSPLIVNS